MENLDLIENINLGKRVFDKTEASRPVDRVVSFRDDLGRSLPYVTRNWMRKPITIFLFIMLVIPISIVIGVFENLKYGWNYFFLDCWAGKN